MTPDHRALAKIAERLAQNGDWSQEAARINEQLIQLNPSDVDAHLRLAKYHRQQGDTEQAQRLYKRALELKPGNRIAENHLQEILEQDKEKRIAAEILARHARMPKPPPGAAATVRFNKCLYEKLVDVARHRGTITYGELGKSCGVHHYGEMYRPLGRVAEYCVARGELVLCALVVNKEKDVPGDDFFKMMSELHVYNGDESKEEQRRWWRGYCRAVWQYWQGQSA